VRGEGLLQKI